MSTSPYASYQKTGLGWLGDIPTDWELRRLGGFFKERRTKVSDRDYPALSVTMQGIVPQLENAAKTNDGDNRKLVCAGDFVINSRSDRKGSSGVSTRDGSVSLISIVLTPQGLHPAFVHHLLRSEAFQEEFYRYGKGIVADLWSTNFAAMKNIIIPIMPLPEQTQIAKFLDYETATIDALIDKQQQLIALLKEKRQAVISHAVTKGLNPDAPMRDSGVEWLGEIPAHWETRPLMHLVDKNRQIMYGIVLPGPNVDAGVPIVKGGDVKPGRLSIERLNKTTFEIEKKYARSRLKGNDLVFAIRGGVGDVELVPSELVGANLTQDAARIAPIPTVFEEWLLLALRSNYFIRQTEQKIVGATVKGINIRDLKRNIVAVPPTTEQHNITDFVNTQLVTLSRLEDDLHAFLATLQERRTALISAAVTGKIDVRNWTPPKTEANTDKEVA